MSSSTRLRAILCADWSKDQAKRDVYLADVERREVRRLSGSWTAASVIDVARGAAGEGTALATFDAPIGVPISYFSSEKPPSEEYLRNLKLATRMRRAMVKEAALQISDLDDAAIQDLLGMVKYIRSAQQAERDHSPASEDEPTE